MILSRRAKAARPAGRVVVAGGVGSDGEPTAPTIQMVLARGKQRSESEFREFACDAGLEVIEAGSQLSGYFVAECRPIQN
ncbi:MAG TPA: hypothetical protein VG028_14695 [Terriglobia bacterium]|nr:hypothetical protein [Terriglobia bacterium]